MYKRQDNEEITTLSGESTGLFFSLEINGAARGNDFSVNMIQANNFTSADIVEPEVTVSFTTYGEVEEAIIGTFSGVFKDEQGFDRKVNGSFRIIREN